MIEIYGNLWDYYDNGSWVAITTNGYVKSNGECVMGRGCAQEAALRYSDVPAKVGVLIKRYGNIPFVIRERMVTFPVKHEWHQAADKTLIFKSLCHLAFMRGHKTFDEIILPRPGCGNGKLTWDEVRPICELFSDWLKVITRTKI